MSPRVAVIRDALRALAALTLLASTPALPFAQQETRMAELDAAAWREDLAHLVRGLQETHANAFHSTSEAELDEMAATLHQAIPELPPHAIVVELARIVAAIGDGHTELWLGPNENNGFHQLPLRLYAFEEGLFVQAVAEAHASLAGARVVRIGELDADEAYARVAQVAPRDNEFQLRANVPIYLTIPEVLHALGIAPELERVAFMVEDAEGGRREVVLEAGPPIEGITEWSVEPTPVFFARGFVSARGAEALYLSGLERRFWLEWLEEERMLFVQINVNRDDEGESFADFARRAVGLAREKDAARIVLDLRHNGGGSNKLNLPWIHELLRGGYDRRGRLFVILGRHTFSAASHLVTALETHTEAIFVGEPTGASPNHWGDSAPIELPRSGLRAQASAFLWQNALPWDRREFTAPHVAVEPTFADWSAGRDAALEACLDWEARPPLGEQVSTLVEAGDTRGAAAAIEAHLLDPRNAYGAQKTEGDLTALGYRRMGAGHLDHALEIFRLVVVAFPDSANAHDSVGEALASAGNLADARAAYQRAIELDPAGPIGANARRMLELLREE